MGGVSELCFSFTIKVIFPTHTSRSRIAIEESSLKIGGNIAYALIAVQIDNSQ
jgi:hypothetical protein